MMKINIEKAEHSDVEAGQVRKNNDDQVVLVINSGLYGGYNVISLSGFDEQSQLSVFFEGGRDSDAIYQLFPTLLKAELNISDI